MKQYMDAQEVAEALGVSRSKAYVIIKQLNDELQKKGFLTVRGKVSRKFFQERTYGKVSEDENTRRN
jgi:sugar-specific transcriptional regulator TrmB